MSTVEEMFVGDLLGELAGCADPARALSERAYLKSRRDFLGVGVPACRKIVARLVKQHDIATRADTLAVVRACWSEPLFEFRRAAVEVLVLRAKVLLPADLDELEPMLRDSETWAILDELAVRVVGTIVDHYPIETGSVLDRWAVDPDSFWLRRTALLCLLIPLRSGNGDWERFTRYADLMMGEREFFIRKAIGWVLRDVSRTRPELVREYVEPRLEQMSGVTRREAVKYL